MKIRADAGFVDFIIDWRVMVVIYIFGYWFWNEYKKEKDSKTVGVAATGSFVLLFMYIMYFFKELTAHLLLYLTEVGIIEKLSQRLVDANLYNILTGFREALFSSAGLNTNLTNKNIQLAYKD